MKCPYCGHPDTRVIDSRPAEDNNAIRRRRSCDECGKRFTTYEKVETIPLIVIKKDNNREQYDRSKIEAGVLRACYKRPVSAQQIQQTIDDIELQIFKREDKEIPSKLIGDKNRAVLLVSFELDEIMSLSDRIEVIFDGQITGSVPGKDADEKELGFMMAGGKTDE